MNHYFISFFLFTIPDNFHFTFPRTANSTKAARKFIKTVIINQSIKKPAHHFYYRLSFCCWYVNSDKAAIQVIYKA